jgi:hypothetical protein
MNLHSLILSQVGNPSSLKKREVNVDIIYSRAYLTIKDDCKLTESSAFYLFYYTLPNEVFPSPLHLIEKLFVFSLNRFKDLVLIIKN